MGVKGDAKVGMKEVTGVAEVESYLSLRPLLMHSILERGSRNTSWRPSVSGVLVKLGRVREGVRV